MTIAFDASATKSGLAAPSITWNHDIGASATYIIITFVIAVSARTVSSVTVDGVAAARLHRGVANTTLETWGLHNPNVGAAKAIIVTLSGNSHVAACSLTYSSADLDTTQYNNGGGSSIATGQVTTGFANDMVVNCMSWDNTGADVTLVSHDSGQTHRCDVGDFNGINLYTHSHGDEKAEPSAGAKNYQVTLSANCNWYWDCVALKNTGAAPPSVVLQRLKVGVGL